MNQQSEVKELVEDFFNSSKIPSTTHEEWLLRLCSQLMQREANTVRILEQEVRKTRNQNLTECKKFRESSNVYTKQYMETEETSAGS
jgi:hypothetical protein